MCALEMMCMFSQTLLHKPTNTGLSCFQLPASALFAGVRATQINFGDQGQGRQIPHLALAG